MLSFLYERIIIGKEMTSCHSNYDMKIIDYILYFRFTSYLTHFIKYWRKEWKVMFWHSFAIYRYVRNGILYQSVVSVDQYICFITSIQVIYDEMIAKNHYILIVHNRRHITLHYCGRIEREAIVNSCFCTAIEPK